MDEILFAWSFDSGAVCVLRIRGSETGVIVIKDLMGPTLMIHVGCFSLAFIGLTFPFLY